jgi:hypothetical protein
MAKAALRQQSLLLVERFQSARVHWRLGVSQLPVRVDCCVARESQRLWMRLPGCWSAPWIDKRDANWGGCVHPG